MSGLPMVLDMRAERCVIVGCGRAGSRKLTSTLESEANVTVIDPIGSDSLASDHVAHGIDSNVQFLRRRWRLRDAAGARLVVIATDDPDVNEAAATDARLHNALVLRCDLPDAGDLRLPAVHRAGRVTLAIDTDGASPTLAAYLRDQVAAISDGWHDLAVWSAEHRPVTSDDLARQHHNITSTHQDQTT